MAEQENPILPPNYVTIIQLKQRWLERKEHRQRESEKIEEQNRNQRQEIQPGEISEEKKLMENVNLNALEIDSEVRNRHNRRKLKDNRFASVKNQGAVEACREKEELSEEMKLMENVNLTALEIDSEVRNRHNLRKLKHNRFASVKNQGSVEACREKEEQLAVDVKLDDPPDKTLKDKADDLGLTVKGKKQKKGKKKKKQTTVVDETNPMSERESTQDQNSDVTMTHREHLPEGKGKKLLGKGIKTDEKKGIVDEHGPNSGNVDQNWEIKGKSRQLSIDDETKTEENRFMKHKNGIRRDSRDARVNARLNRKEVQKEKSGALVWMRKGEISSGVSHGFHSQGPSASGTL